MLAMAIYEFYMGLQINLESPVLSYLNCIPFCKIPKDEVMLFCLCFFLTVKYSVKSFFLILASTHFLLVLQYSSQYMCVLDKQRAVLYPFYTEGLLRDIKLRQSGNHSLTCFICKLKQHFLFLLQLTEHLLSGEVPQQPIYCPDELYEIMVKCWNRDRTRRPTCSEFLQVATRSDLHHLRNHIPVNVIKQKTNIVYVFLAQ